MRDARFLVLVLAACAPPAEPVDPPRAKATEPAPLASYGDDWVGLELPGDDICKRHPDGTLVHPIEPGTYEGILRNARCRQQKLLTMAWLSDTLGVDCSHCHAPEPSDPKKLDFAAWTDEKRAANWMVRNFVQGLRAVDGTRVSCASCHAAGGEPVMKLLGEPRDPRTASEWMHEIMASRFVEADGDRLRCRTCHEGMAPGADDWQPEVILALAHETDGFVRRALTADPAERPPSPATSPPEPSDGDQPPATEGTDTASPRREGRPASEGSDGAAPEAPEAVPEAPEAVPGSQPPVEEG